MLWSLSFYSDRTLFSETHEITESSSIIYAYAVNEIWIFIYWLIIVERSVNRIAAIFRMWTSSIIYKKLYNHEEKDESTTPTTFGYHWQCWVVKFRLLYRIHCVYSISKYTKEVFSLQWAWQSLRTLPAMVNGQAFRFIAWYHQPRGIRHLGTLWATLWVWTLGILTSTRYINIYIFIILYNILKIAELDYCQIIILSIYVPSTHA